MDDEEFVKNTARRILSIPAVSPENGGSGELKKAEEILNILDEMGYKNYEKYYVDDNFGVTRPNFVIKTGNFEKTLWIIVHMDTVPAGDVKLWAHDPYDVHIENGNIYARGAEDNGQGLLTALLLLKKLDLNKMRLNLGIAFVSDEETGNTYGIKYLISKNIFKPDDLIVVPDAGTEDGNIIETAEKSVLWLKFTVRGRQGHASMPQEALNAFRLSSKFITFFDDELHKTFSIENKMFIPSVSTFEPTKHEKNIDNINTIPGEDIFYYDCRILPGYNLEEAIENIQKMVTDFTKKNGGEIDMDVIESEPSPSFNMENSEIVLKLKDAIEKIKGKKAMTVGIGGSTFAAFLRARNIPAAVWSTTVIENAHMPNEFCRIDDIIGDVKIYEYILYN
ncbi:M20 family metallo-hydrolase [Acidiplasma sp.]|nr:M20 family metallo-hydrolase [Acidiplasma sp.]